MHRILVPHGLNRLAWLDRPTGPGELVHVDIKKLGNIPDGGGWRTVGRTAGDRNRQAASTERKSCTPVIGYSYIHSAVDDHSRLAYSEILPNECQHTAIAFWQRANAFHADYAIPVKRVLTDNGPCYKARAEPPRGHTPPIKPFTQTSWPTGAVVRAASSADLADEAQLTDPPPLLRAGLLWL